MDQYNRESFDNNTNCYVTCMANRFSESFVSCLSTRASDVKKCMLVAVSELRSVCTGFKLQRPGLNPWFIHVAFVLVEVTLEQVSVRPFSFTLLVVITPITHTHIGLFGTVEKDALSHPPHKPKTYRSVKSILESTQLFLL